MAGWVVVVCPAVDSEGKGNERVSEDEDGSVEDEGWRGG